MPFGLPITSDPSPLLAFVYVAFNSTGQVYAIDVKFDWFAWDDFVDHLKMKYGSDWKRSEQVGQIINFETGKSEQTTVKSVESRQNGLNPRTHERCSLSASSQDLLFQHSTIPFLRAVFEIKLLKQDF